nr:6714_t:CDS:2 [Entrophospora candida]
MQKSNLFEFELPHLNISLSLIQHTDSLNHGTTIWDSSIITSKYLYQTLSPSLRLYSNNNSSIVSTKKTCIELGSGCGLLGLVMCSLGFSTTLTDLSEVVNNVLSLNVTRNLTILNSNNDDDSNPFKAEAKVLDWTKLYESSSLLPYYDYIVSTDCIYKLDLLSHFISCLKHFSNTKTLVVCGLEKRDPIVIERFLELCKKIDENNCFFEKKYFSEKIRNDN